MKTRLKGFNFRVITSIVTFCLLTTYCDKQETISKTLNADLKIQKTSIADSANPKKQSQDLADQKTVSPNLYPGPCPYQCDDPRCKAYSDYCGTRLKTEAVTDINIKNTMISAFQNLPVNGVNLSELSSELGLPNVVSINDIDFDNIVMTWDENDPDGKAITANFKTNSNSNDVGFGFSMFTNGATIIKPTIIKTSKNQYLKYYDLDHGLVSTIDNYVSSNYAFSSANGAYIASANLSARTAPGCGQAVMDCMTDIYANRGCVSVWTFVQTAFIPQTAVAAAATCAIHNCL